MISWRISGCVSWGLYLILSLAEAHAHTFFYLGEEYNNVICKREKGILCVYSNVPSEATLCCIVDI